MKRRKRQRASPLPSPWRERDANPKDKGPNLLWLQTADRGPQTFSLSLPRQRAMTVLELLA